MPDLPAACAALAELGIRVDPATAKGVGGGCIHGAWRLAGPDGPVFLKTCHATSAWLLEAEADGLAGLRQAAFLRVPAVLGHGTVGDTAWLALEWLELCPAAPGRGARPPAPGGRRALRLEAGQCHRRDPAAERDQR
ncbi:MAG TPA: fructosamine kinase family protein [Gammaproteobacteria bacterium]|nr:fructosamine kinase family protein [Gammaproteobacteria bacterium]